LRSVDLEVNQIVDFTHEAKIEGDTRISRVATMYQPSFDSALEVDKLLKNSFSTLGCQAIVTEEVLFVGEYS